MGVLGGLGFRVFGFLCFGFGRLRVRASEFGV